MPCRECIKTSEYIPSPITSLGTSSHLWGLYSSPLYFSNSINSLALHSSSRKKKSTKNFKIE
jgi:hypothetical protein